MKLIVDRTLAILSVASFFLSVLIGAMSYLYENCGIFESFFISVFVGFSVMFFLLCVFGEME